jgi:hypothetical protein
MSLTSRFACNTRNRAGPGTPRIAPDPARRLHSGDAWQGEMAAVRRNVRTAPAPWRDDRSRRILPTTRRAALGQMAKQTQAAG